MKRIILSEILRAVILNLLYTSMYSDGSRLYPESNPLVGRPFKLVCDTETTITTTVTIRFPNGDPAGYCDPASEHVPADCTGSLGYSPALNETENTVTISASSLASDVNGTWTCAYLSDQTSYNLSAPIREIRGMTFNLFPTSFTNNVTSETTSISLSATYECINLPVYFKWFVVDSASKKIDISGTHNVAENSSVCTSGFSGYTETKEVNEDVYSRNSFKILDGSYMIGVEVHYTDEVTTLHSIKYFDTYFVFTTSTTPAPSTTPGSRGTNTPTEKDCKAIGILAVCGVIAYSIVTVMVALRIFIRSTVKKRGKCFLTFCQFIEDKVFNCRGNKNSKKMPIEACLPRTTTPSVVVKGDPDFIKDKVLTLNWLLGFVYLVLYGLIVGVIVLPVVYYGYSEFQGLVIGVGSGIVLALSFICLVVVWMMMKFVYTKKSKCEEKPENSTSMITEKVTT